MSKQYNNMDQDENKYIRMFFCNLLQINLMIVSKLFVTNGVYFLGVYTLKGD